MYPFIIQGDSITIVINNKTHTVNKSHIAFEKVKTAIKEGNWDVVVEVVDPKKVLINFGAGNVHIQGDKLFWKDREFHNALSKRMIQMYQEGFSIEPLINFMDNLMLNPSYRSVEELYGFLERNKLPITPDGCFLAYKKVNDEYYDVHTQTVLNKPFYLLTDEDKAKLPYTTAKGDTVSIENDVVVVSKERNAVDDDSHRDCSYGLHICSLDYLNSFGGSHTLCVKVNPRDVVAFPRDYNGSKGRCCRYEIINDIDIDPGQAFTEVVQSQSN